MNIQKPKSWREVEALPFVLYIEKEPYPETNEMSIFIWLKDDEPNPVTGGMGGGFYVANFKDFISHYWL